MKIRQIMTWGAAFMVSGFMSIVIFSFQSELEMDGRKVELGTWLVDLTIAVSPILLHGILSVAAFLSSKNQRQTLEDHGDTIFDTTKKESTWLRISSAIFFLTLSILAILSALFTLKVVIDFEPEIWLVIFAGKIVFGIFFTLFFGYFAIQNLRKSKGRSERRVS